MEAGLSSLDITGIVGQPPLRIPTVEIPHRFMQREIRCHTHCSATAVETMDFLNALRGAVGRLTLCGTSAAGQQGQPCTYHPASLHDLLFLERKDGSGRTLAKPYRFATETGTKGELVVTCRLYGLAADWAPALAELVSLALTHPIHLREHGALTAGVADRIVTDAPIVPLVPGEPLRVVTVTPLRLRAGHQLTADSGPFRASVLQRFVGLAAWNGFNPEEPLAKLRQALDGCVIDLHPHSIQTNERHSRRQNRRMHMNGWHGSAVVQIQSVEGLAMLSVALPNGIGSSTALGYGTWTW